VCSYNESAADGVEEVIADCCDATLASSCHDASGSSSSAKHRLTRSTSDTARRCPVHQRSTGDERSASTPTPWRVAGSDRSTLPRASRDTRTSGMDRRISPGDVWRPRNDADLCVKELPSQRQRTNSFERAGLKDSTSKSPTTNSGNVVHQPAVWSGSTSSPWDAWFPGRQSSVQAPGGAGLKERGKLDYCNSPPQQSQLHGPLSRSWFDIERPTALPSSPMSSSTVGLGCLRQSTPADGERTRVGTITETKTACNICSSETFIAEGQDGQAAEQLQVVAPSREPGYHGGVGGSLPRCYGQRTGDVLGVPGSTGSMPRGLSMFISGPALTPPASSASSSSSSAHTGVHLSTAAAGNDVRVVTCPSPKRSLSNRDDECKLHARGLI